MSDIHKYLESGIDGNTLIELENGHSVKLKNIKINDQLYFGERVLGIGKIETKDINEINWFCRLARIYLNPKAKYSGRYIKFTTQINYRTSLFDHLRLIKRVKIIISPTYL